MSSEPKHPPPRSRQAPSPHDGWTAERQITFIETLAETGCVDQACRAVGMSDTAAYRLRTRPCGMAFRAAWDAALDCALTRLEQAALSRALHGTARPVYCTPVLSLPWQAVEGASRSASGATMTSA